VASFPNDASVMVQAISSDTLEGIFRAHRKTVWGLSYRLTGCAADADDVVQDTFARAAERSEPPVDPGWRPWLIRVATNKSLDVLRRRRRRRYVGSWLPSPIAIDEGEAVPLGSHAHSTERHYEERETLSFAFLVALEALSPRQRAVLLLRDVLDYSAREVADALDVSEENVRIIHHRARRAMREYDGTRCRGARDLETRRALEELLRCLVTQDAAGLEALLTESVRTITDGGGEYNALHAPMIGRPRVAQLHLRVARRRAPGSRIEVRSLNGAPALVIQYASSERRQAPRAVLRCELTPDGRIRELHVVLASRKLTAVSFA
jgi:RNA polymerase sigma-70 factor (ECF subfamily)